MRQLQYLREYLSTHESTRWVLSALRALSAQWGLQSSAPPRATCHQMSRKVTAARRRRQEQEVWNPCTDTQITLLHKDQSKCWLRSSNHRDTTQRMRIMGSGRQKIPETNFIQHHNGSIILVYCNICIQYVSSSMSEIWKLFIYPTFQSSMIHLLSFMHFLCFTLKSHKLWFNGWRR